MLCRGRSRTLNSLEGRKSSMSLTLAFELSALRCLADPEGAVREARQWSEHVGVVTDRPPHVLTKFTRDNHIRNDFEPAVESADKTLEHLLAHFDTDRFVFVAESGTDAPDGWELQSTTDAADRAGWELADETPSTPPQSSTHERDDWP
jgi:hypothetical protein